MVSLRTGVDLIEIDRIRRAVDWHGDRFLCRVFTAGELTQSGGRYESLAGKFAAKEAVAKALGTGIWRHGICWTDIEVHKDPASGAPSLRLYEAARRRAALLHLDEWSISISHDRTHAVAFVVALWGNRPADE
jgi:holo-[acyl-carrier protein] synthase